MGRMIEDLGGGVSVNASREQFLVMVDVLRNNLGPAFSLLAESLTSPLHDPMEIEEAKMMMGLQIAELPLELVLKECIQVAGYGGGNQRLGRFFFSDEQSIPNLNASILENFRDKHFIAPNMVLAGAGVDHQEFVQLAEEHFGDIPKNPKIAPPESVKSIYTGGECRQQRDTIDGFTRIAVGFEVGGWHSDDLVPTCVLQILLGGGDSFSAGGPGKGMYSRLYREVLNRYYWAEASEAFTSLHDESGIFGISGSSVPKKSQQLSLVFFEHFAKLAVVKVCDEELARARNMLKCNVLTQMESRMVLFEDIGRQMLTYGKRETPKSICDRIDQVTADDIIRIAKKMVSSNPTIAAVGHDLSNVPRIEDVQRLVLS